eukprot:2322486-Amphidinium_carterae.1
MANHFLACFDQNVDGRISAADAMSNMRFSYISELQRELMLQLSCKLSSCWRRGSSEHARDEEDSSCQQRVSKSTLVSYLAELNSNIIA